MKQTVFFFLSSFFFLLPFSGQAQLLRNTALPDEARTGLRAVFDVDQDVETALPQEIARILAVLLSFVGVLMLVIILYSGFLWLTAGGNEDQIKKAKQNIRNAAIGLVIVLTSFVAVQFVSTQLERSFAPPPPR